MTVCSKPFPLMPSTPARTTSLTVVPAGSRTPGCSAAPAWIGTFISRPHSWSVTPGKILRRARRRAARRFRSARRWVPQLAWRRILWCRISLRPRKLFWESWKGAAKHSLAGKGRHQNPRVPRRRWHAGQIAQSSYEQESLRDSARRNHPERAGGTESSGRACRGDLFGLAIWCFAYGRCVSDWDAAASFWSAVVCDSNPAPCCRSGVRRISGAWAGEGGVARSAIRRTRSEEHTSELQSPCNLVCRLLLEKKKNI